MSALNDYGSDRFLPLVEGIHYLFLHMPMRSEISSICVTADHRSRKRVEIHLAPGSLAEICRGLVEWDTTLHDCQIMAELSAYGAILRLGLAGNTDEHDTPVQIWGTVPYDPDRTGLLLQPDQRTFLSLDELAHWMLHDWIPDHPVFRSTIDETDDPDDIGESVAP